MTRAGLSISILCVLLGCTDDADEPYTTGTGVRGDIGVRPIDGGYSWRDARLTDAEPDAEPDAAEPDAAEPDAAEPDAAEPDAAEPLACEQDLDCVLAVELDRCEPCPVVKVSVELSECVVAYEPFAPISFYGPACTSHCPDLGEVCPLPYVAAICGPQGTCLGVR